MFLHRPRSIESAALDLGAPRPAGGRRHCRRRSGGSGDQELQPLARARLRDNGVRLARRAASDAGRRARPLPRSGAHPVNVAIDRLRLGQPALGREGLRARRARSGPRREPSRSPPIPRCVRRGRPRRAAGRRRLRGLPARARRRARHGGGHDRGRARKGPPVLRHLRRHAAHGDARPRIRDHAGPRLDSGRRGADRAGRSAPEDPAYGLEHARRSAAPPAARRHPTGADGLHAYFVHSYRARRRRTTPTWSPAPTTAARSPPIVARDNMAGAQFHPEKSQRARPQTPRQFPEVAAVILFPAIDLKDGRCVRLHPGRHGPGDGLQRRSGRAGGGVSRPRASNGCTSSISTARSPASR